MSLVDSVTATVTLRKRSENDAYGMKVGCAGNSPEPGSTKIVAQVTIGGIAAEAGLNVGDVILGINGVLALDLSHDEMIEKIVTGNEIALTVARTQSANSLTFVASSNTTVTLTKSTISDSFGFELDTEMNGDGAVHSIRKVVGGGIADGELFVGDEVIAINGEDAHHKSHDEMLEDMTGFSTLLSLVLHRDSMLATRPPADGAQRLHFKVKRAHPAESLGFALCTMPDGSNRVGVVAPGGLACSAGVMLGDNVISVNDDSFPGLHAEAASGALAGAGCVVKIAVDRHPNGPAMIPRAHHRPESSIHAFHSNDEKIMTLKLERHTYSETIGFNVETDDEELVHDVGVVAFGSAAARGGIVEGDRIHAINGIICDGMTHNQLVDLIKSSLAEDITIGRIPFEGLVRDERLTYLTLELDRESADQRIGMSIASEDGLHEIEEIYEDMVASHSGLSIGDRIVSIDGWSVEGLPHDDVTGMLVGKLALRMSIVRPALRDLSHGHVVRIVREPGQGLGVVFSSELHGVGATQQIVHTVEGVVPGSGADEAGLQVWDHLVSLNGIGLGGSPHDSVLDALAVCDVVTFNVERPTDAHLLPTMEVLQIMASRDTPDTPFGIHIATRESEGVRAGDTTVQQVAHNSILDKAGLKKNDQLITVNGQAVFDMQHPEVEQMFSNSINLVLSINRSGKAPEDVHYENLHIMVVNRPGEQLGFVFESLHHNGATVVELVRDGSHAEAAGLLEGDEIYSINEHTITDELSHHMLVNMLTEERAPGQPLVLGVRRPMDHVTITDVDLVVKRTQGGRPLGFMITSDDMGSSILHYFESVTPGSDAESAGCLPGDEIQSVSGVQVSAVSHDALLKLLVGNEIHVHVRRHVHGDAPGVTLHNAVLNRATAGQPLGFSFETVNPGLPRYKNWISNVVPGGLGNQADLREDDVLLSINGHSVTEDHDAGGHNPTHGQVVAWLQESGTINITYERASHMHWHHQGEIGNKFTVVVQRDSASVPMGITLAALDSGDTAVSKVEPGSIGDGCGLREGDEVLLINGKATKDCTHAEVLNMVRAEANFTMECMRFSDGSGRVDSWVEPDTDHIDVLTFTLARANDHASFGFALGQDHSDGSDAPHVVEIVKANKPADGKLELGDELSKINGLSVAGLDHEAVVGQLKAGGVLSIELEVKRHKNSAFMKIHDYKHLTVTRASKDVSFGFSVACYQDQEGQQRYQSHRIEVINAGGLADGILAVGDEVVEINGTIVQQLSHEDVIALIVASNTLDIAVQRRVESPVREVVLARGSATVPWGASFETAETEEGAPIGHYVKSVKAASIADEAGLYEESEVLTVNGQAVRDVDHTTFIALFKGVKKVTLEVISESHKAFEHETMDVVVEKAAGETFGFAVYESGGLHFVETVVEMSAAANKLREYDEIKSINGTAVQGKTHEEAVALLQTSSRAVLVVHRHPLDPSHGVNKTLTDEGEGQLRKDLEAASSRLQMQRALELALVDFTKDAAAAAPPPPSPAKAAAAAAAPLAPEPEPEPEAATPAPFDEASRAQMQNSLEGAIAEYGERGAAPQGAPAAAAAAAEEGDDEDDAMPEPPTSPISNFPTSPVAAAPPAAYQTPTQTGSALKAKIQARRAAAGVKMEAPEKSTTPLKERIAARQAAAASAKTVAAGSAEEGAALSPVGRVEPVDPNRKAQADEAFMSTFGATLNAEE